LLNKKIVGVVVLLIGLENTSLCSMSGGSDTHGATKTNLEVLQGILIRLSKDIAAQSKFEPGDRISVRIQPADDSWLVEQSLTAALRELGTQVFSDTLPKGDQPGRATTARYSVNAMIVNMQIHYDGLFHEGIFGSAKIRRTATVSLAYQTSDNETHEIRSSRTLFRDDVDTVLVEEISILEQPVLKSTHAILPDDNALDRFIEPLIIVGTTAVAVYLFFHIRS
jgi:hypothetical protein